MGAVPQEQRGEGVPKVVNAYPWQAGPLEQRPEGAVGQVGDVERGALDRSEYEAEWLGRAKDVIARYR